MRLHAVACIALLSLSAAAPSAGVFAAEGIDLEPANNNVANIPSLQRGAKYFVNYCLGCHSAQYVRYSRLAEGLLLSNEQLVENLMFTGEQPFDTMTNAMKPEDAERWFGKAPPDLSLIARSRGTDYIYNYLRGFYADDTRPTGANNLVLPNTAMPDVLWELQGIRRPIYGDPESKGEDAGEGATDDPADAAAGGGSGSTEAAAPEGAASEGGSAGTAGQPSGADEAEADEDGERSAGPITGFEVVREGLLTEPEFDQVARDIVNFLDYIGEPIRLERQRLGLRVIGFLLVLLLLAYLLKKEIWKDVA